MRRKAFMCILVEGQYMAKLVNGVVDLPWPPTHEDILAAAKDAILPLCHPWFPESVVVTSLAWIGPVVDE